MKDEEGFVYRYPCTCSGGQFCYIVRHPAQCPPISYPTMKAAKAALKKLRTAALVGRGAGPHKPVR